MLFDQMCIIQRLWIFYIICGLSEKIASIEDLEIFCHIQPYELSDTLQKSAWITFL